jgi:hypothetical protein
MKSAEKGTDLLQSDLSPGDVRYLKHMIFEFRLNKLILVYQALEKQKQALGGSLLEMDSEIPYVAVSTRNRSHSCLVGYDIDSYTLKWYMQAREGSQLLPNYWFKSPNVYEIIDNLTSNYEILNK